MTVFRADYFDGITAGAKVVEVSLLDQHLRFVHGEQEETFLLAALRPQAAVGSARRVIELPDGGRLETEDVAAFDRLRLPSADRFWRRLHMLENHLGWVLVSLVLAILAGWGMIRYGVPVLAEQVAHATPVRVEIKLGEQVLAAMDHQYGYFRPSTLTEQRRASIVADLKAYCLKQPQCPAYRLEFRQGGSIGANAMALPGGIMVITDELIALAQGNPAESNHEIIAVLAHELGHVERRHALRQTLQGTFSGLVLVALTGDFDSLAAGLPAVLMQMNYSRQMENEADQYALASLQRACIPPQAFAGILQKLQKQAEGGNLPEVLSSHPDTQARIQPFVDAEKPACKA
ncbi:M48 family metallopeptidase [Methylobacillus gramineus]|uniref:M48 family metallopeptidase n=1 Tax=Methylobacillus gramineus TaxID=755169 RepID=UPI001CFFE67A|nr:M48 family metallopeptidase [Methylobacillus gramineus]MCB5184600.1 M48 family metallopeptidase [Methylobacillus gramineus]